MTTFEHAMLGINGVLATGLHRRFGWQIAALAGVAAVAPDWDGLPILWSVEQFDRIHRLWGHNVLACVLLGGFLALVDYRLDLATRIARAAAACTRRPRNRPALCRRSRFSLGGGAVWMAVGILASLSQIPADMVVSGAANLSDWELQPFWPISRQAVVFPLIPWGDPGIAILFGAGMLALARWPHAVTSTARGTILAVVAYLALRGLSNAWFFDA